MKPRIVLALVGASLVVLGVAVNPVFLYGLFAVSCPLMHLLGGHGSHDHNTTNSEDNAEENSRKNLCH